MNEAGDDIAALRTTFERDGAVLARGVFDAAWVADLVADFDEIVTNLRASGEDVNARWESATVYEQAEKTRVVHTHHVQNHSALWLDAFRHGPYLDIVEALIGPDIVLHHSKLFEKPAGSGAPFPMHQDWRYFPTEADSMIAAIIHLTEATEPMGCVRSIPGSHRFGRRASTSGRLVWDDPDEYRRFLAECAEGPATSHVAQPGDVLFFSYFTVHGSGPNSSTKDRKTVLAQLFSGRDRLDPSSEHSVSGLVLRGRNHHATRSSVTGKRSS